MPILLTTPFDPGSMDPGVSYPEAKIVSFGMHLEARVMNVRMEWGQTSEGIWTRGVKLEPFKFEGINYDQIVAMHPETYQTVKNDLYTVLQSIRPDLAGTIV